MIRRTLFTMGITGSVVDTVGSVDRIAVNTVDLNNSTRVKAEAKNQRKVPYLSFFDDPFDINSQLPIDDPNVVYNHKNDFDYNAITTHSIYEKKKEMVAYLKFKFSNPSLNERDVYEELKNICGMRERLLARRKPFSTPLTIENKIVTTDVSFTRNLLKIEFFKYKKNIPHSYLYADVDAFVWTLCKFLINRNDDKSSSFDFNGTYIETFNKNIGKDIDEKRQQNVDRLNAKQLKDFPIASKIDFFNIYDENTDADVKVLEINLNFFKQCLKNLPNDETSNLMDIFELPLVLFHVQDIEYRKSLVSFSGRHSSIENSLDVINDKKYIVLIMSSKFDEYNDYLIYKTIFNGHRVPVNMGIIYYMIYRIAQTSIGGFFKNYKDELSKYTMRRILMTKCRIAFTTSKFYPQLMVPLMNAVYYSFFVSKKMFENDPIYFYQERLRELHPYAKSFYNILNMYRSEKNGIVYLEKGVTRRAAWLNRWGAQLVDDDIKRMIRKSFIEDDHGYMIRDFENERDKPVNMIRKAFETRIDLNNYIYSYYSYENRSNLGNEIIDKYTMRPRFVINKGPGYVITYYDMLPHTRSSYLDDDGVFKCYPNNNVPFDFNKVISLYKTFQNYVKKHRKFPKINDYHLYVYNKYNKRADGKICFFDARFVNRIDKVYNNYMKFIKDNDIKVPIFINAIERSERLYDRIRIEDNGIEGKKNIEDIINYSKRKLMYLKY
ncbi:Unknown (Ac134) [Spodoptera exigua multiple nucleopolyhedrovirus]|nr:Unknown (Ac134) [Spodoptera exigua multiple nucleopolyhedrovirus]CDG73002.1 Unknown (Ac134) [Spodoptera exigua multiple nucleopolyhedrovirus]CDG73139.1 Unknown (Ac134) [Spodoptera exigua multiple nucleopolyhedrovirus]CDG73277.1 Unknown (Ac134) [Spodoptera exigua multiple nucleopolyhedrovirus]